MLGERQEVMAERLIGFNAAATYLNLNLQTVRRLIERGILQPVRIPTLRRVLFDRCDLDRLIESGKSGEASDKVADESIPFAAVGADSHGQG
jgi:excisionase family DNA binding protein